MPKAPSSRQFGYLPGQREISAPAMTPAPIAAPSIRKTPPAWQGCASAERGATAGSVSGQQVSHTSSSLQLMSHPSSPDMQGLVAWQHLDTKHRLPQT